MFYVPALLSRGETFAGVIWNWWLILFACYQNNTELWKIPKFLPAATLCLEAAFKLIFGVSLSLVTPLSPAVLQERSPIPAQAGLMPKCTNTRSRGTKLCLSKTNASKLKGPTKIEIVKTRGAATQNFPGREGKGCTGAGTWTSSSGFPSRGDLTVNPKRGCLLEII